MSSVNRLLFTELGEKGSGDIETVNQLLREEDSEVNCINSANESLLIVAVSLHLVLSIVTNSIFAKLSAHN